MSSGKAALFTVIITLITLVVSLLAAEIIIRIKNADGTNYHIEMWRYSKELKERSDNAVLGHEHVPNDEAELQNVNIRINSHGMRGEEFPPITNGQRRIIFLGSSATLGWGIEEEETLSSRIEQKFKDVGKNVVVMNAGIGNYNTKRYVELFLTENTDLKPTDIVVNYYLNDAEILDAGGGNAFLRNSQLAVTGWILMNRLKSQAQPKSILEHYQSTYEPDYQGFKDMKASLEKLAEYAKQNNIRLHLLMMPEVHDLVNYEYEFAHDIIREIAQDNGYNFIDALPAFQDIEDAQSLWAMPGDPHPNAEAHRMFADVLYPHLNK